MNAAVTRRLERGRTLDVVVSPVVFWEYGALTVEAEFSCLSASTVGKVYHGTVGFNGVVYKATCDCPDHWRYADPEQAPTIDGVQVCKHSLAALLALEWTPIN